MSTPTSWRDYFDARREAHKAMAEAQRAFDAASERWRDCDDQVRELEKWAEKTHETTPFDGSNYDEQIEAPS